MMYVIVLDELTSAALEGMDNPDYFADLKNEEFLTGSNGDSTIFDGLLLYVG